MPKKSRPTISSPRSRRSKPELIAEESVTYGGSGGSATMAKYHASKSAPPSSPTSGWRTEQAASIAILCTLKVSLASGLPESWEATGIGMSPLQHGMQVHVAVSPDKRKITLTVL